jgi:aldehyde dehydrogenase (NAD+)
MSALRALRSSRPIPAHLSRPALTTQRLRFASTSTSTAPSKTLTIGGRQISIPTGIFINNTFRPSISGATFSVENPATGRPVLEIAEGQPEDVDLAVSAARTAFQSSPWANSDAAWRGKLMDKLADLLEKHKEDVIAIEMLDTGKTYRQASTQDFPSVIGTLRYYAGWADKVRGETNFNIPGTFAYTRREPVGVCGQIIPWK